MPPKRKPALSVQFEELTLFEPEQYVAPTENLLEVQQSAVAKAVGNVVTPAIASIEFQPTLPGVVTEQKSKRRAAFGRYVGPEHFDLFGDYDLKNIPKEDRGWITPNFLDDNLITARKDAPNVVSGIALNTYEYNLLIRARNPKYLRNKVVTASMGYERPTEQKRTQAEMRGNSTIQQKLVGMTNHIGNLEQSNGMLKQLVHLSLAPGYAHTTDAKLIELYANAWNEFENIIDVVHIVEKWTDEQRDRADPSFLRYLTKDDQIMRVHQWKSMILLARRYVTHRIYLFTDREDKAKELLGSQQGQAK